MHCERSPMFVFGPELIYGPRWVINKRHVLMTRFRMAGAHNSERPTCQQHPPDQTRSQKSKPYGVVC